LKHWDYIIGAARPFYAKKVLITGTESCGKTTLTKKLAKTYYSSWSEELGRYYSRDYLGGDDSAFTLEDFDRIGYLQYEQDMKALSSANRVCFFDTDAVVTEFYCEIFMGGKKSPRTEAFVDPSRYDLIIFMEPTVKWVDDGTRFLGEQAERERLAKVLWDKYESYGFDMSKFVRVSSSDYFERFNNCIDAVEKLLRS